MFVGPLTLSNHHNSGPGAAGGPQGGSQGCSGPLRGHASDARRFTERRKKTVRFDGRHDSGIDTSSTFTSSEDSNPGGGPKVHITHGHGNISTRNESCRPAVPLETLHSSSVEFSRRDSQCYVTVERPRVCLWPTLTPRPRLINPWSRPHHNPQQRELPSSRDPPVGPRDMQTEPWRAGPMPPSSEKFCIDIYSIMETHVESTSEWLGSRPQFDRRRFDVVSSLTGRRVEERSKI